MALFTSTEFNNLEDLLCDQLQDLYDAEQQLTKALPKMAKAADSPQLKKALEQHLQETEDQVERLERVFAVLNKEAKAKTCEAMKGLIAEGEEVAREGRAGVTRVAVRTSDGRAVAEFTGYSRTVGGALID